MTAAQLYSTLSDLLSLEPPTSEKTV